MYLVMLPGLDGTGLMFKHLLETLPADINPIVVNYPTTLKLSYEDLLPIVIKALPKEAPFVLLGESFSGPLAIKVAASKPLHLKGLMLCATFLTCPQAFAPRWFSKWVPAFPFKLAQISLNHLSWLGNFFSEEMQQALVDVKPEVLAHRLQQVITVDVSEVFASLTLPTAYLMGEHDFIVPRHNLMHVKALQPNIQVLPFDSGHFVLQTQPYDAAKAIVAFIQQKT